MLLNHDNGGWADYRPPPEPKVTNFESCQKACEASPRCVQFLWKGLDARECILMFQIRHGLPRKAEHITGPQLPPGPEGIVMPPRETGIDYTSGWMTDRIDRWREERQCEVVQWVGPSIERIY